MKILKQKAFRQGWYHITHDNRDYRPASDFIVNTYLFGVLIRSININGVLKDNQKEVLSGIEIMDNYEY